MKRSVAAASRAFLSEMIVSMETLKGGSFAARFRWMVAFSVFLFGYTTLMGWSFYGEQFLEYLFGRRIVMPYRWLYCLLIPIGAVAKVDLVWAWGDILNGAQVFPNLIGIIGLSGIAAKYAKKRTADEQAAS